MLTIEMGIGWKPHPTKPGILTTCNDSDYVAEIERLRSKKEEGMMTIVVFQLLTYSCVSTNDLGGDLMSKMCRWDAGQLYASKELAEVDGTKAIGQKIHSFIAEDRKIEKFKVQEIRVVDR